MVRALALTTASVVLAHNRPNGAARPSRADETLTQALKAVQGMVDVRVLDHFVMMCSQPVSIAELAQPYHPTSDSPRPGIARIDA